MIDQPIPRVTEDDIKRIAMREFGESELDTVLSVLHEYGKQSWHQVQDVNRVRAAILKLSRANPDLLLHETQTAILDYRDVLAPAEYPNYLRSRAVDDDEKKRIVEADWKQYMDWFDNR